MFVMIHPRFEMFLGYSLPKQTELLVNRFVLAMFCMQNSFGTRSSVLGGVGDFSFALINGVSFVVRPGI